MKQKSKSSLSFRRFLNKFGSFGSIDVWFLLAVLGLLCVGLIMMFSASYPSALYDEGSPTYYISRQALFAVIGIIVMLAFSHIKADFWRAMMPFVCGLSTILLIVVLFTPEVKKGFHRWLNLGFTTFQPSEIAKFAVIVIGAFLYTKYAKKMSSEKAAKGRFSGLLNEKTGKNIVRESWVPTWMFCIFFGGSAILVFAENHLSGCILMLGIGAAMMYLGGVRERWFIVIGIAGIALVVLVCIVVMANYDKDNPESTGILKNYMAERIIGWLDKDYEPRGARWQTNQALYAIASGGFFGKGLGNSTLKYNYVSEPQNDMIFSIVCEELGFLGAAIIILMFVFLVYRGVQIGMNAKSRFSKLLAMGIVFQIALQVILNIAVATDSMPNTGISLPFFSYGGTSLVMLLGEMGIVLSVSRENKIKG